MMGEVEGELLQQFRVLEESLWRAETRFDDDFMDTIFATDFFEFGRSGKKYTRSEMFFGSAKSSEIQAELPLPDFSARFIAEDVVQVTYQSRVTYDGIVEVGNRSSIWSRSNKDWQLRFHQGTAVQVAVL